jgi:hypothetical protein
LHIELTFILFHALDLSFVSVVATAFAIGYIQEIVYNKFGTLFILMLPDLDKDSNGEYNHINQRLSHINRRCLARCPGSLPSSQP